jgi:cyanate lyase
MIARFASTSSTRAVALPCRGKASHRCLLRAGAMMTDESSASSSSGGGRRGHGSVSSIDVAERTKRLMDAKAKSGLTYDDLASRLGVTNTYAAQLLLGQARLTGETASKLAVALSDVSARDVRDMQEAYPMRGFDDQILKEPNVYRTYEAIAHYGEAIKCIINEQCGDG